MYVLNTSTIKLSRSNLSSSSHEQELLKYGFKIKPKNNSRSSKLPLKRRFSDVVCPVKLALSRRLYSCVLPKVLRRSSGKNKSFHY